MQMLVNGQILTEGDQYALNFMLGLIGQGHGHHRVRAIVEAIKFIRLQYGHQLKEAKLLVEAYEEAAKAKIEMGMA